MIEALIGFAVIFTLALLRIPLAFAMGGVGIVGIGLTRGWEPALASTAQVVFETGFAYTLSVIPLFILMGNFVARAGLATELFTAANAFIGMCAGALRTLRWSPAQALAPFAARPSPRRPPWAKSPIRR